MPHLCRAPSTAPWPHARVLAPGWGGSSCTQGLVSAAGRSLPGVQSCCRGAGGWARLQGPPRAVLLPPPQQLSLAGCGGSRAPRFSARCAAPASAPTTLGMAPVTPTRTRTCRYRCPRAQGQCHHRRTSHISPLHSSACRHRAQLCGDPCTDGETEARSGGEKFAQGCSNPTASWTVLDAPSATGISRNTDVATKASITEQPKRRRRRQREAPSPAAKNCPLLFIYIIYMYVFVYDFLL